MSNEDDIANVSLTGIGQISDQYVDNNITVSKRLFNVPSVEISSF